MIYIITFLIYSIVLYHQASSIKYMKEQGLSNKEIIIDVMMCVKCQSFILSFIILIFFKSFIITLLISSIIALFYLGIEKYLENDNY